MSKIAGIIGGMGPEATSDLFSKIVELTPAEKEQENIEMIIYNNPKIPDRTEAILFDGKDPFQPILGMAKKLEKMEVDFLLIPCNTAHYYYQQLQEHINIPIINMIEETAKKICYSSNKINSVGLLATKGTIETKIYDDCFSNYNIDILVPAEREIKEIMDVIYTIKYGEKKDIHKYKLNLIANDLVNNGADCVVLGCTELSLLFDSKSFNYPVYNSQNILAEKAVELAFYDNLNYEVAP
ncbi:aspartate/glutamate racemase family protein [Fuchsiella alkaliacetigena]|uniref:aspartate/glutamate racemase family protein n=1 Tax=Fuchsiella alkaliacetigena TaxID=957042 RepID=UPI002009F64C|nr:amino acid racemase [Fuchsiella alkaliacetigena]MCK8824183.1 amino acid racemase [Fuchsiella alkaliacetigena]